ncbi:MAG: sulfite exporter TauE/SafE family protein [Pikeienuella sp.]
MQDLYLIAIGALLAGGMVKGALGIGLPTTAISIMAQFTDPRTAVALGLAPMVVSNVWQFYRQGEWMVAIHRFWPLAVVTGATIYVTSLQAVNLSVTFILMVMGAGIALFSLTSLVKEPPFVPDRWEVPGQVISGTACGVLGGLTGVWSPPMLIFLMMRRLEKEEFVRVMGLLLFMGAWPLLGGYAQSGLMTGELFLVSCLLLVPTFAGYALGERVRRRLDPARFQKVVLIFFLLMGLNLVRKGLMG